MLLRVCFGDNDFSYHFRGACETFLEWHYDKYERLMKEVHLEEIRKAIVVGALGSYITEQGTRWHIHEHTPSLRIRSAKEVYDMKGYLKLLDYFNKRTKVEVVETFNENDWNAETCYIDFYNVEVRIA
jgi:hypothetical protein